MRHFEMFTETVFKDVQLISTITKQIVDVWFMKKYQYLKEEMKYEKLFDNFIEFQVDL